MAPAQILAQLPSSSHTVNDIASVERAASASELAAVNNQLAKVKD